MAGRIFPNYEVGFLFGGLSLTDPMDMGGRRRARREKTEGKDLGEE